MNVTYLPVYYPSEEEQNDPKLYARNVRQAMVRET
jgi:lysophosphatidylcholine acyltransferase/lyso-PAF acetyltransferase